TGVNKGYHVKWSQPPDANESFDPPHINGWDEWSDYNTPPMMADDWQCRDDRPITDIHWWGSFKGWKLRKPPAILPKAFHIGIWTDVALGDPCNLLGFSHPGTLIWENFCDSYAWNFAGVDVDPQGRAEYEDEMCFQFNQLLNEDEWFYQTPNDVNVYWLSVSSIYDPCDRESPDFHEWGWKTRPHIYNDDAVQTLNMVDGTWPPKIGSVWGGGAPVEYPPGTSWDLAFELTTNEGPPSADLRRDGIVDLRDLAVLANQWLTTTIP
ncbi:MAG: DUF7901 domain-containing protein, partial [Planctomycetota bacterium]